MKSGSIGRFCGGCPAGFRSFLCQFQAGRRGRGEGRGHPGNGCAGAVPAPVAEPEPAPPPAAPEPKRKAVKTAQNVKKVEKNILIQPR